MTILLKRAYETPDPDDGFRVLVDRLWPRGLTRSSAQIDLWHKEIAPSSSLRKWFGHDPEKWLEFRDLYFAELGRNPEAVEKVMAHARRSVVTLVYAAKDTEHTHALVLKEFLENAPGNPGT